MTGRRFRDVLWVLAFAGMAAAGLRFVSGLGRVTGLSDSLPWGVWKVVNMVAGVALSTGGFVFAGAVHVLRIERLKPLLRPALVVACLGYASSCLALFLDIGRPFRIWHPLFQWNIHSFLFEVSWCVMLYFTITLMEVLPIALEKGKGGRLVRILHRISPVLVIVGITLSTLHHTTLGSLFLVSPTRLHALWYTTMLPVHFYLSAVGAGILSVVLVTYMVSRFYRRPVPDRAIRTAAIVAGIVLFVYGVAKVWDLAASGKIALLLAGQWESWLWTAEIAVGVLLPVAVIAIPRLRRNRGWLGVAAAGAIAGVVLNRLDVGIFAYVRSAGTSYVPSLAELAVTLGIPAAAGLGFFAFIERFHVFDILVTPRRAVAGFRHVSLLFVVAVSVCLGIFMSSPARSESPGQPVAAALDTNDDLRNLVLDGDRDGDAVRFPHGVHADWMDGSASCRGCHHLQRPGESIVSCHVCHASMERPGGIFDHDLHVDHLADRPGSQSPVPGNGTCRQCHPEGRPPVGSTARACTGCHQGGSWAAAAGVGGVAPSYVDALHGLCSRCHDARPGGRCGVCHTFE